MPPILIKVVGIAIMGVAAWGLINGKIMAGSRGLKPNYYTKKDSPVLYYCFVFIYFFIGAFLLFSGI